MITLPPPAGRAAAALCAVCVACASGAACRGADAPTRWTPPPWASPAYEASVSFSPDGREAVFMRADPSFRRYRLLVSRCEAGRWTRPEAVPFAGPASADDADPGHSADGRQLYFVSTRAARPGAAPRADFDIWVVDRLPTGWGAPRRLPEPVNSPGSELLPRPGPAGVLYFGSDRAGGHGQGDVYLATPGEGGGWVVGNLGPPVSTAANEYEAAVSADGRVLVVVADRGDRSHLYRFDRREGRWTAGGRVPARADVFQVGPTLSPTGDRLLFAQADPADAGRSGELFLVDLAPPARPDWPPRCAPP